jgi:hypothetical protein
VGAGRISDRTSASGGSKAAAISGVCDAAASFWNRFAEAGVSGSTWTTQAAADPTSSGSIQSVTGRMLRLKG